MRNQTYLITVGIWLSCAIVTSAKELDNKDSFFQMCDASAGFVVGGNLFAVASDEDNWLRIYDRMHPGVPVQALNLSPLLGIESESEADLEAVARIGDTSYWITSHGADKDGDPAPDRRILFALRMEIDAGRVSYTMVGKPYRELLADLISAPSLSDYDLAEASQRPPKDRNALNIEGLCAGNGQLWIGFRNPIPEGRALLVPLSNPDTLVSRHDESTRAEIGAAIELDLGGRGVRSIEYSPSGKVFWIVAGSFDETRDFALYRWKGPGHLPQDMDVDFGKWHPEALVIWDDRPHDLQILSDDGERVLEDIDADLSCKSLPLGDRQFRSGWFSLRN